MSHLEDLIAQYCPNGVEFVTLNAVAKIRNGKTYAGLKEGAVPVYGSGGIMTYVDEPLYDNPSVLLPRKGSLSNIFYVDVPFRTVDTIFYTEIDSSKIYPKFLYYWISRIDLSRYNEASGVPSLTKKLLDKLMVAVPPLQIQEEIVRILDSFTQLEAELEAELEARRKQYECYRNFVFHQVSDDKCEVVPIGSLGHWNGGGTPSKSNTLYWDGEIPWFSSKDMKQTDLYKSKISISDKGVADKALRRYKPGTVLIVTRSGILKHTFPVGILQVEATVNQDIKALQVKNSLVPRYVLYAFQNYGNEILRKCHKVGGSVDSIDMKKFYSFNIPVPPLEEQERIVGILDKFDALVNDLTSGLPAEIAARRKQYEYYRDKLLSFKELEK